MTCFKKGQLLCRSKRAIVFQRGLIAVSFIGIFNGDNWNFIPLTSNLAPQTFLKYFRMKPDLLEVTAVLVIL